MLFYGTYVYVMIEMIPDDIITLGFNLMSRHSTYVCGDQYHT
jgi:hypothetical protein